MLIVDALWVRYGPVAAVRGISLRCEPGEIVTLLGPNGAGKSSTLHALSGALAGGRAEGSVTLDGAPLLGRCAEDVVAAGMALVPEGRRIFTTLSVRQNLALAAPRRSPSAIAGMEERFEVLGRCRHKPAGLLSGGEQQQLAIARALLCRPRVLLLDEPSLGLAPLMVDRVFELVAELCQQGLAIVLVEQNARRAADMADRTLVLRNGEIAEGASLASHFDEVAP